MKREYYLAKQALAENEVSASRLPHPPALLRPLPSSTSGMAPGPGALPWHVTDHSQSIHSLLRPLTGSLWNKGQQLPGLREESGPTAYNARSWPGLTSPLPLRSQGSPQVGSPTWRAGTQRPQSYQRLTALKRPHSSPPAASWPRELCPQ